MDFYSEWDESRNKDELKFYDNVEFRREYTQREMASKAKTFKQQAKNEVKAALASISSQTNRNRIRVLSLGCGPGSDLLGLLGAVDSALQSGDPNIGWEDGELKCSCTGVDAFDWNRDEFDQRLDELYQTGDLGRIRCTFLQQDMESFVLDCFDSSSPLAQVKKEFDFICLSYADAGRNLPLIGTLVPRLLSEFGRVIVLDNNIKTVRELTAYGYMRTHASWFCTHTRGRSFQRTLGTYRPVHGSPIQRYSEQKVAEARLQEQRRKAEQRLERKKHAEDELSRHAMVFKELFRSEVKTALRSISKEEDRNRIRLLSMGCGPGSFLLGLLRAVDSVLRRDAKVVWDDGELKCSCTGVDNIDRNWDALEELLDDLYETGNLGRIRHKFVQQDTKSFVLSCFDLSSSHAVTKFDFICLSFADIGSNLELIGSVVPRLLTEFGRVIVLSKDSRTVRRLAEYGYACTSVGSGICMHSRGRSNQRIGPILDLLLRGRSADHGARGKQGLREEELGLVSSQVERLRQLFL